MSDKDLKTAKKFKEISDNTFKQISPGGRKKINEANKLLKSRYGNIEIKITDIFQAPTDRPERISKFFVSTPPHFMCI